ncbi:MAG: TonB-dependent receptor [Hyphomonadaceae bacterium]|nr:TonB-dependent receptor [Hyphomonadaceae bacterium]
MTTPKGNSLRLSLGASARALLFATGMLSAASPALAQEVDEEEIVVTATQRSQALQDVPVAVTPVTAAMIENSGIRDIQDLTSVAPSLQFNVSESEASATARLRGVGTQGSNPGLESAVGIFVDGVYRARNGVALTDLGDLRQIEVLRGPQGTLFGRNTSAGLITISTAAPNLGEYLANAEATYGDFAESRVSASVNIPLSENEVALRLFGAYASRDGFIDTNVDGANPLNLGVAPNQGAGDSNTRQVFTVRGQLAWEFSPDLYMRVIGDFSERDEACCAAQIYDPELLNGNPVTNLNSLGVESAPVLFGTGRQQWVANLGGYGPNVNPGNPLGALGAGNIGDRSAFTNRGYPAEVQDRGVSVEFNWDAPLGSFTSITAFRVWTSAGGSDSDYSQADLVYVPQGDEVGTEYRTFTQEFRLAGTAGPVDWLLGAFLSTEAVDRDFSFRTGSQYGTYFAGLDSLISGGSVGVGIGVAPSGGLLGSLYNALAAVPAGGGYADRHRQTGDTQALFTHNIISLTDRTDLTIGLRYTHEDKELSSDFNTFFDVSAQRAGTATAFGVGAFGNCNPLLQPANATQRLIVGALRSGYCVPWLRNDLDAVGYDQTRSENEWSGVISLRQELADRISVYGSVSRGYKGGGFNLDRNFDFTYLGGTPNSAFDAELVDAYEIGLKSGWFGGDLLINLAVFQNQFENFQLNTFNGIQFVVTTVPEVNSEGAELDVIWRTPIEGLSFQGGVAYTDATYGEDTGWVAANRNPITGDLTLARLPNSQLTNAPEWTATTAFTYERPIFNGAMNLLAYIDARYVDDQNTGSDLRPSKLQPAYTLVNARLGLTEINEHFSVELWARNLLDEEYAQIMFDVPLQQGTAGPTQGAFLGDPRTYGVTLRARY